jgi:hypothetical protein
MSALEQSAAPHLLAAASELASQVRDVYGEQLERAFELLHDSGQGETIRAAIDDDLVASMLVVHDLHPKSMAERVADSLAELAETLPEHGGRVHLREIDDHAKVRVEIDGGSTLYRWRTRLAVEKAIDRAAPEHGGIEVVGADAEPPMPALTSFIPIDSIRRKAPGRTPRVWIDVPELLELDDGEIRSIAAGGSRLMVCKIAGDLYVTSAPTGTADGFDTAATYRIVADDPPTIENSAGARLAFDNPFPVQRTDHTVEVMVP